MSSKEPTLVQQKARELAVAIKDEILGKVKPGKFIYRSHDKRKFFSITGGDVLNTVELVSAPNWHEGIQRILDVAIKHTGYSLSSGCWGVTKCPVGAVTECTEKDLDKFFLGIAQDICYAVHEEVTAKYRQAARRLGVLREPYDCEAD